MAVQIISREIIKPAKMPLDDLKTFPVSLLDKLSPDSHTPIIFFYSMNGTDAQGQEDATAARLKLSLSETLARFPMLAGRFEGDLIHCSEEDVGALFVEATVKVAMADFLKKPDLQLLAQFLPLSAIPTEPLQTVVQVAVQVNFFACGGIAVGVFFLHKIIDGTTMSAFARSWAASCEGTLEKVACGNFSSGSSLFPTREIWDGYNVFSSETPFVVKQGRSSSARRFVFDAMAISNLKTRAKSASVANPTSVEAVTCFIWNYAMKASRCRSSDATAIAGKKELVASVQEPSFIDSKWGSVLIHVINMRKRIQPPLSEHEVGNIYWRCPVYYEASNTETKLADLESILRQSLSEINNDFIQTVIGDNGFEALLSSLQQLHQLYEKGSETFLFSSWRNMGFNEVNFGWGKPIWVACGGNICDSILRNIIILMDSTTCKGIEAWVILDDETMNLLENDSEFLEFASPNPSINLLA